jgi:lambda family phage tail tape measure protein
MAGSFYLARKIIKMADEYTLLDNKLKLVTKSSADLSVVQDGLYEQSLRSHSSYSSSVDLYSRFAKATESIGTSQKDLLRITETLNKAMIISGATQEEAKNGIIQLSQGMASGVLRGEEFNSIMENGSRIARMLSDYLQVDIGQLRKMASEGKITSETMIKAFTAATEKIDEEFGKMQPTISQAMTDLQTVFGRLVSDANKGADGTKSVAEEIKKLAETIDQNRSGIIELFTVMIRLASQLTKALGNIGQSIRGWAAVGRGQLGIFDFATMNAEDLSKWLEKNDNQLAMVSKRLEDARLEWVKWNNLTKQYPSSDPNSKFNTGAAAAAKKYNDILKERNAILQKQVETLKGSPTVTGGTEGAVEDEKAAKEAENRLKRGQDLILSLERERDLIRAVTREEKVRWDLSKGPDNDLAEPHKQRILAIAKELDALDAAVKAEEERKAVLKSIDEEIAALQKEADTYGMSETAIRLYEMSLKGATEGQKESVEVLMRDLEIKKQVAQVMEDIKTPLDEYAEKMRVLNDLLAMGEINQGQYAEAAEKARKAMEAAAKDEKGILDDLKKAIEGWGQDSADALVEFGITGKKSFSDFADSVIKDILRMIVYQTMMQPLMSGISGAVSGFFSGAGAGGGAVRGVTVAVAKGGVFSHGNITPLARGGVVSRPTIFPMARGMGLMGEAGPEAVMPLTRLPGGDLGVKSGGGNNIKINIINNNGSDVSTQQSETSQGLQLDVMIDQAVAKKMGQAGSSSNRVLKQTFGAREGLIQR